MTRVVYAARVAGWAVLLVAFWGQSAGAARGTCLPRGLCASPLMPLRLRGGVATKAQKERQLRRRRAVGQLMQAAAKGRVEEIRELISAGVDPNSKDPEKRRPVHWAAAKGQAASIVELCKHSININARDRRRRTALHVAAARGRATALAALCAIGAQLSARDRRGLTPLALATKHSEVWSVEFLKRQLVLPLHRLPEHKKLPYVQRLARREGLSGSEVRRVEEMMRPHRDASARLGRPLWPAKGSNGSSTLLV